MTKNSGSSERVSAVATSSGEAPSIAEAMSESPARRIPRRTAPTNCSGSSVSRSSSTTADAVSTRVRSCAASTLLP